MQVEFNWIDDPNHFITSNYFECLRETEVSLDLTLWRRNVFIVNFIICFNRRTPRITSLVLNVKPNNRNKSSTQSRLLLFWFVLALCLPATILVFFACLNWKHVKWFVCCIIHSFFAYHFATHRKKMTTIEISGVTVKFPFPPYEVQRNYMAKVIECLDKSQNAMLESPTGLKWHDIQFIE